MNVLQGQAAAKCMASASDPFISGKLRLRRSGHAYCPVCEKLVELIGFEDAAELFRTDRDDIEILAGRHVLHRIHNRNGLLMICSISLFDSFEVRETKKLDPKYEEAVRSR